MSLIAYEENLKSLSYDADASIGIYTGPPGVPGSAVPNSGMQYRPVKLTGAHQVGLAVAAGGIVGVLQNKPQRPGAAATVGYQGVTLGIAAGPLASGIEVIPDGTGRFIAGVGSGPGLRFETVSIASVAGELVSLAIS